MREKLFGVAPLAVRDHLPIIESLRIVANRHDKSLWQRALLRRINPMEKLSRLV